MSIQAETTDTTLLRRVAVHLTAFVVLGGIAGGLLTAVVLLSATLSGQAPGASAPAILVGLGGGVLLSVMFGAPAAALTALASIVLHSRVRVVWYYVMSCGALGSVAAGALFVLPQILAHQSIPTSTVGLWGLVGGLGGLVGGWVTRPKNPA